MKCPACEKLIDRGEDYGRLLSHMLVNHGNLINWLPGPKQEWGCACGFACVGRIELLRHLRSIPDLQLHFAGAIVRGGSLK